jgi:hypothetical protein
MRVFSVSSVTRVTKQAHTACMHTQCLCGARSVITGGITSGMVAISWERERERGRREGGEGKRKQGGNHYDKCHTHLAGQLEHIGCLSSMHSVYHDQPSTLNEGQPQPQRGPASTSTRARLELGKQEKTGGLVTMVNTCEQSIEAHNGVWFMFGGPSV